ncbi:MAG: DNA-binding LytR/AlgR family response regulator [Halioglobus sp.]|jgi:DNA-binding LytR/AlgR family response regulator
MTSTKYRTVVIDDEEDIRTALIERLIKSNQWEVVGEAESVTGAIQVISESKPDCIFLDIKLREGDAFRVLELMESLGLDIPPIILNTGYAQFEYAQQVVNNYSDEVLMLLKKPFWEHWESKEKEILEKLSFLSTDNDVMEIQDSRITIRVANRTHFLDINDILFIEVESTNSGKCKLCTGDDVIIINKTLAKVKAIFPSIFKQISRQTIVNKNHIKEFDHEDHVLRLRGIDSRNFDVGSVYRKNIL